jgi:senataxin
MDWRRGAVGSCTESEGFHKLSVAVEDNFQDNVSENDLLLISKEKVSVVQVKFVV